ncbi:MAG TPA: GAF domain-containing protein [Nostocaceae cyanobacterium]|nr:GAF domain-containing protein [Nostocaceae cyanobacterium]
MKIPSQSQREHSPKFHREQDLQKLLDRLTLKMRRDELIRNTTKNIRELLQVDRVVLYYFYEKWHGQVTFESLSAEEYSILGSTGEDDCFNDEYAALYIAGRVRAIADIELETIETCHRDFLRSIRVRANLVVPVLVPKGLWGLLIAHHCQSPRTWSAADVKLMQTAAQTIATDPHVLES